MEHSSAYVAVSVYLKGSVDPVTSIPFIKRIDDGIRLLEHLGISHNQVLVDAWCIHPLLIAMNDREFTQYKLGLGIEIPIATKLLSQQFNNICRAYPPSNVKDTEDLNIYFMYPELKAMLLADKVPGYVDFCMAADEGLHDDAEEDYVPDRMEYFNIWLSHLGVDETNFEPMRNCVSRLYPWNQ